MPTRYNDDMRLVRQAIAHDYHPLRTIEWIIAVSSFVTGLYLFSPAYQVSLAQNGPIGIALLFTHPLMVLIWGGVLIVGSCLVAYGLWNSKPQPKSNGWFLIILARLFQVTGSIVVSGILPISWLQPLTIAAIVIVLWGKARAEVKKNATS